ncbi:MULTISPECIES: PEP-CTERM sorting domain-containing protein [unclassified Microcystis]|uniref:PEP-CTERM sorting domain-containing protein n=1 Tax=unclassified Microcystis TaxID=2643300 RepID=UPI0022C729C5|nr:PEP-CTERM sorting domain-containing protein [Microcystis sp. LE19-195.1E]MCZ8250196.1 PEP-CTERM sorting domain-containing protein [Microcystis sp. LE19-195.1E]
MMTTNKLTKTFASGSLAIGVLAGAVLTATSANAAVLTWGEWTNPDPTLRKDLIEGDKKVTFKPNSITGGFAAEAADKVALTQMGDHYYFRYDAMDGLVDVNMSSGSFTYTIQVTTPGWEIFGVDLDSNVSSNYGSVTETFGEILGLELVSTNGSQVPASGFIGIAPHTLLTVTNTLAANPNEGLMDFQNSFHQVYINKVPEPGTILGLLAVGGLGLVSRFKKQK